MRYHVGSVLRVLLVAVALLLTACPGGLGAQGQCEPTIEPPTQLLFAPLGQTISTHVVFKNPRPVPMFVQRLALEPDDVFAFVDERRDLLVPAGTCAKPGTVRLQLDFTATRLASRQATLSGTFVDDFGIVLRASGTGPRLEVPETVSFAPMSLFDEPATRPLSVRNIGTVDSVVKVALSAPRAGNETTTADELCVGQLQAGQCMRTSNLAVTREATVSLTLSPKTAGEKSWEVLVSSDEPRAPPRTVRVVGQVLDTSGCQLRATPDRLEFGLVPLERRVIAIENSGTGPCLVSRPRVEGNRGFSVSSTSGSSLTLEPAGTMTFELTAAFTSADDLSGAALVIDAPRPGQQSFSVPLSLVFASPSCLALTESLDLGSAQLVCSSRPAFAVLGNTCPIPLVVTGVSTTPPFAIRSQLNTADGGAILLPGGVAQTVGLVFRPGVDAGAATGTVTIDLVGGRRVTSLRATGEPRSIAVKTFEFSERPRAELLFVLDEKPSFVRHHRHVREQLSLVRDVLDVNAASFRVAVTTTDVGNAATRGRFRRTDAGAAWADSRDPRFTAVFDELTSLADAGATQTSCLEAAARAVSTPLSTDSQANAGFRRDGALAIVCLTDDTERSPTPDLWRGTLRSLDAGIGWLSYSVFGPFDPSCPSVALDDGGHQVSIDTFGGVATDLCSPWVHEFQYSNWGPRTSFSLGEQPDLSWGPLIVEIDGVPTADRMLDGGVAWRYDGAANAIQVLDQSLLAGDEPRELTVRYWLGCR